MAGVPQRPDEVTEFRIVHADTFVMLCRMHLSFVLDMPYKLSKEPENTCGEVPLTFVVARSIRLIMHHLSLEDNVGTEGLFRKSGSVCRQQILKSLLMRGTPLDFKKEGYSVHDCACVLKSLLADLSEPLLTSETFTAYCKIPGLCRPRALPSVRIECLKRQLKAAQLLLLLLPPLNYSLASELLVFLHQVSSARELNRMTPESLALLFTPVILCPREPVCTTLTFCVQQKPKEEAIKAYTERALAELFDYVNEMPETKQKKRFVKQVGLCVR
uniref:Uncharacterized protein n=2 Tax=Ixodes scapularis TaxID=6945 RepID=A0A1S4KS37_IXOSC